MKQINESGGTMNSMEMSHRLDHSLGFLVNGLARLMRNALEEKLKPFNVSPTAWTVLMALGEGDKSSQTDLGKRTLLDGATVTRVLDVLEARKFITRNRDDADRRVQIVELTREGRDIVNSVASLGDQVNDEATSILPKRERENLEELLRQLISLLQNNDNGNESEK